MHLFWKLLLFADREQFGSLIRARSKLLLEFLKTLYQLQ